MSRRDQKSTCEGRAVARWGWGRVKDHHSACPDCEGDGQLEPDEEEPEDCYTCDGTGERFWGSFYWSDRGECGWCKRPTALISDMYEDTADYDRQWVCLPCYLEHHRQGCGCELWIAAELDVLTQSAEAASA